MSWGKPEITVKQHSARIWTTKEVQFVKENYNRMSADEIGEKLGRTRAQIYGCAERNGFTKNSEQKGTAISKGRLRFRKDRAELARILKNAIGSLKSGQYEHGLGILEKTLHDISTQQEEL